MPFLSELHIHPVNGDEWELDRTLTYYHRPTGRVVVVPAGFQLDLASIPRIFRPLIPVHDRHTRAAAIHDWLYVCKGRNEHEILTRSEVDEMFYDAMRELGVSVIKSAVMYAAVRAGGWVYWNKHD